MFDTYSENLASKNQRPAVQRLPPFLPHFAPVFLPDLSEVTRRPEKKGVLEQYTAVILMSAGAVSLAQATLLKAMTEDILRSRQCLFGITDIFVKLLVDNANQPASIFR